MAEEVWREKEIISSYERIGIEMRKKFELEWWCIVPDEITRERKTNLDLDGEHKEREEREAEAGNVEQDERWKSSWMIKFLQIIRWAHKSFQYLLKTALFSCAQASSASIFIVEGKQIDLLKIIRIMMEANIRTKESRLDREFPRDKVCQ